MMEDELASPCVSICQLDASQNYCIACWRTLDEIANWMNFSAEQKRAMLDRIAQHGRR